jgi:lysophospholipase L1-like esterase
MTTEPRVRRAAGLAEGISYALAAACVFAAGAFAGPYAAFVLLPIAVGFCTVRFFQRRPQRSLPTKWLTLLAGNGLILALLLSMVFLGFESYYRFLCDRSDSMANTLVSGAWLARHFHVNSSGFRDDVEYPSALTPGKRRVTFVGDSCTAGYGVKNVEDRFVNRIRRLHPDWEVHAVAKLGLDTSTEVEIMHNLTVSNGYRLDQVVLVYNMNDIGEVMPGWVQGYKEMMADPFRTSWLCQNSYFVNLFYHRWQLRRSSYFKKYFDEVEGAYKSSLWEIEKMGLTAFCNMTRIRGGRLLVVTLPYMDTASRFKFAHDQLDEFWKDLGVPYLDLLPTFSHLPPSKLVANAHDAHPNEYAHALAADAIDQFLKREIPNQADVDNKPP